MSLEQLPVVPLTDEDLYGCPPPPEPTCDVITFSLTQGSYALPIADTREVLPYTSMTPLPGAPAWLLGLTNVRGNIVSVTDPHQLLALSPTQPTAQSRLIIIATGEFETALFVDAVGCVMRLPVRQLEPALTTLGPIRSRYIAQLARTETQILAILKTDMFLGKGE